MNLKIVIESGEDGYFVAHVPALKSCWSQGKTREEALQSAALVDCQRAIKGAFRCRNNVMQALVSGRKIIRKGAVPQTYPEVRAASLA